MDDDPRMYLVLIAWIYVALMMAAAEATAATGTVLGAIFTFVLYGLLPVGLIGYVLDAPRRRRTRNAAEHAADAERPASAGAPDAGGKAAGTAAADPFAPVREEP